MPIPETIIHRVRTIEGYESFSIPPEYSNCDSLAEIIAAIAENQPPTLLRDSFEFLMLNLNNTPPGRELLISGDEPPHYEASLVKNEQEA